ncbi:Proteasome component (PCI) domain [Trinorchestia longiramus]|nr:Proteasome component (PCI) domain [Trinorchestia longiramus]
MTAASEKKDKKSEDVPKKGESIVVDGGRLVKMEVDYSTTCDEKIPAAHKLVEEGKLTEAIESLMALEKQTRTGGDAHSTSRVLVAIVEISFKAGKWDLLNENIVILTKKRSQIKMAVTKMVQRCCEYVDQTPDKDTKLKLMDTLRTVTAGKIYVEVERARLTHQLALLKEADGDLEAAATAMQEMPVETFGSMEKKEKVEMILEQMRLCLARKDYVRTQIISKKVTIKFFDSGKVNDLKLKFYRLMIELDSHDGSFLSICRHYLAIYKTSDKSAENDEVASGDKKDGKDAKKSSTFPKKSDAAKKLEETKAPELSPEETAEKLRVLKHVVLYLILAPYDNEQSDLLHRVKMDPMLPQILLYKNLLQLFATEELIKWSGLCSVYEAELRSSATDVFSLNTDQGNERWTQLRNRVVEHNIRMMAKYYTRIKLARMAELLDLAPKECEEFLCQLVVSGTIIARTDRLEGVVSFGTPPEHSKRLNDWADSLHTLMALVNRTTHLINKEQMVHRHLLPGSMKVPVAMEE